MFLSSPSSRKGESSAASGDVERVDKDKANGAEVGGGGEDCRCLICGRSGREGRKERGGEGRSDSERFRHLCLALGVKSTDRGFKGLNERLPLCDSCADVVERLASIPEEIQRLEEEYAELQQKLRKAVEEVKVLEDPEKEAGKVIEFRECVRGNGKRGRGRPRKDRSGGPALSRLLKNQHEALQKQKVEDVEEESPGVETDTIVFEENLVREEVDSQEKEDKALHLSTVSVSAGLRQNSTKTTRRTRLARKEKAAAIVSTRKRKLRSGKVGASKYADSNTSNQDENEVGFPVDAESGHEDVEDDEKVRKWKIDKKRGKMWYDGIEVSRLDNALQCSLCNHTVPGEHNSNHRVRMKFHIRSRHMNLFTCPICSKRLSLQKHLDHHIQAVHQKSVSIPCEICGKPFTTRHAVDRHRWSHFNEAEKQAAIASGKKPTSNGAERLKVLECSECGKKCKGSYNLKRHEMTHLEKEDRRTHICHYCGSAYSSLQCLRVHIQAQHESNQIQWYPCLQCPKRYPRRADLNTHVRLSHVKEKPYVCEDCGESFSVITALNYHLRRHTNSRPFQCQHCEMAFYRSYHLNRHVKTYHLNPNPPSRKLPYRSDNGTNKKMSQKRTRKQESQEESGEIKTAKSQNEEPHPDQGTLSEMHEARTSDTAGQSNQYEYTFSSSPTHMQ